MLVLAGTFLCNAAAAVTRCMRMFVYNVNMSYSLPRCHAVACAACRCACGLHQVNACFVTMLRCVGLVFDAEACKAMETPRAVLVSALPRLDSQGL